MAQYLEHRIPRGEWSLYAREYARGDPALVLMYGFPDNLLIYDALAPALAAAGRRAIAFDFLGYGASDKPANHEYTLEGLESDLEAVLRGLRLPPVVLPQIIEIGQVSSASLSTRCEFASRLVYKPARRCRSDRRRICTAELAVRAQVRVQLTAAVPAGRRAVLRVNAVTRCRGGQRYQLRN